MNLWLPVVFSCAVLAAGQTQTDPRLAVTIDSGLLAGGHFGSAANEIMFLGIPYAAPPIGDRRWRPPQPVEKFPATLALGRMAKVPVIAGSNSDKRTTMFEEDFRAMPTLASCRAYLKNDFLNYAYADEFFRLYPAATDADVRAAVMAFDTDYGYGFPVHRYAWNMAHAGQTAWLYYVTYPAHAKFYDGRGAFDGIEMKSLTGWFYPSHWGEPTSQDKKLVDLMTGYWSHFARTGDPNGPALPQWPAYDPKADLVLEIGHEVKLRTTPHAERFALFERSLNSRLRSIHGSDQAETTRHWWPWLVAQAKARQHHSTGGESCGGRKWINSSGELLFGGGNRKAIAGRFCREGTEGLRPD